MRRRPALQRLIVATAVLVATIDVATVTPEQSEIFVLARRYIDPVSGEQRGQSVFQVVNGAIGRVLPIADFERDKVPAERVINLGAATVLPGLIDAHVHLTIGGAPQANALAVLRAGFTTVVDLGATTDAVLRLRDQIAAGTVEGPRIFAAGLWAGKKDGICEFGGIGVAGGPDGFRARVRDNVTAGADVTKVCISTWLAEAYANPHAYEIDDASLSALVEASAKLKRPVIAHAISLGSVNAAVRAGVSGLAHAALLDQPTADAMRKQNMFMIPTLASLAGGRTGPAAVALREAVGLAHQAGVRLVFGTDGGVLPHGENGREFGALTAAGLSTIDAIRAATINAASAFNLGRAGTLEVGAPADLIALDGNPLEDVTALTRVVYVMRAGRPVSRQ